MKMDKDFGLKALISKDVGPESQHILKKNKTNPTKSGESDSPQSSSKEGTYFLI